MAGYHSGAPSHPSSLNESMLLPRPFPALAGAVAAVLTVSACHSGQPGPVSRSGATDTAAIRRDIAYLASNALEGRGTGTPGNDSAAAYIARQYASLGLAPVEQKFVARSVAAQRAGLPAELQTQNVYAIARGTDSALRGQFVVIGAHFDHLGRSSLNALDPDSGTAIRPGADDNASGTAAVIELARIFTARPTRRSLVFVNFSGEELGVLGSQYFLEHPPVPVEQMVAMLNFDMVGRLRDNHLLVYGVTTATELRAIVDSANTPPPGPFALKAIGDGFGPSDHASFYARNVPVLQFFTDIHEDYHRSTDVASKINVPGEGRVVDYAERIARDIADRPERLTFFRSPVGAPTMGSGAGNGAYFGSVPDMGATDVQGVRLAGVTPGSPAEKAGAKTGDVIVEFGGVPVGDLYQYSDALKAHRPGDVVQIVVLRNGERVTLTATLGTRGT